MQDVSVSESGMQGGDVVVAGGARRLSPVTLASIFLPRRGGFPRRSFGDSLIDIASILQRGITEIYGANLEMTNLPYHVEYIEGTADNYRGSRRYSDRLLVHLNTVGRIT